jgi:acyl-CoA hydrolase
MSKYYFSSSFNVFPQDLNMGNTLFGGKLLAELDCEAAKVAKAVIWGTEANNVVTACFDRIDFKAPAKQADLVVMEADVFEFGKTSMKIQVRAFIWKGPEKKDWILICDAKATFVALKDGKPFPHGKVLEEENNWSESVL